jgi:tripartite ATP-independent transporter DctM subunit
MTPETLGYVLIGVMVVVMFVGLPIAFTLMVLGLVFGYLGFGGKVFDLLLFQTFQIMREQTLASVPLFIFMGMILENAGLMERLFRAFQLMLARVRGSLYLAVILSATIFAAATGIVGASVTILGIMAGPAMKRAKYDTRLAAGAITAGGTLGILIPPSVMLIVMGPVIGVPVTDLYAGAVMPGLLLAGLYASYALLRCFMKPELGPALPLEERAESVWAALKELLQGLVPAAMLILAALGSILAGVATPTEAAAMGALGGLVLTIVYRRFTWQLLGDAVMRTMEVSSMILFLVAASNFFGAVFSLLGTPEQITQAFTGLQLPPLVILLVMMALIFALGWPLEWVPIVLIFVPIMLPIVRHLGFDLLWFGILVAVNLQTAWLSPPVALSAYFLKGVVPDWELKDIYLGMMEFMVLQVVGLVLLIMFPNIVLWLPRLLFGK